MGYLLTLCMFLFVSYHISLARYTNDPDSGSGEGDGTTLTSATQSYEFTTENSVKNLNGTITPSDILETIKQFLNEYMLLVIVVGSLVILLIVTMCAAVIMSHKRKASAYYPSSFAPKEYVNHDDRNGGIRAFNEIPEKPHDAKAEDVLTSSNQLQTDILNAAQNLKSPTKGGSNKGQKIQEETQNTEEPLSKELAEEITGDKCPESFQNQEENPNEKVKEGPAEQPEVTNPTCNCQGVPDLSEEIKPTDVSQEDQSGSPEAFIPKGDHQGAPGNPKDEIPDNSQETAAEIPKETKPTDTSQGVPAVTEADAPNVHEQINGKGEGNTTPTECGKANDSPCKNQESQKAPETEPCGV